jgi:hypothetical protein
MILVNTYEDPFGDLYPKGVREFKNRVSSEISRNVIALTSFKGDFAHLLFHIFVSLSFADDQNHNFQETRIFAYSGVFINFFFFLEQHRRTERHFIKVEKYKGRERPPHAPKRTPLKHTYTCITKTTQMTNTTPKPYARKEGDLNASSWSLEAPAKHQRPPSNLTGLRISCTHGLFFSKTCALRCFQIFRATKIIKELSPLRTSFAATAIALFHQPEK